MVQTVQHRNRKKLHLSSGKQTWFHIHHPIKIDETAPPLPSTRRYSPPKNTRCRILETSQNQERSLPGVPGALCRTVGNVLLRLLAGDEILTSPHSTDIYYAYCTMQTDRVASPANLRFCQILLLCSASQATFCNYVHIDVHLAKLEPDVHNEHHHMLLCAQTNNS